jgi:hypothetical protein
MVVACARSYDNSQIAVIFIVRSSSEKVRVGSHEFTICRYHRLHTVGSPQGLSVYDLNQFGALLNLVVAIVMFLIALAVILVNRSKLFKVFSFSGKECSHGYCCGCLR